MRRTPLIIDIKGNSLDDGPGIRSVIFFKGCPLSCIWCHNPESKTPDAELSFDPQKCIACDTCINICQIEALSKDNPFFIDRKRCTLCFECVKKCPSDALSRVGWKFTQEEIIEKVVKDKPFYDTSGGGVTFSGGEPTIHMEFLSDLLVTLKNKDIHTLIETCGYFNFEKFKKLILPYIDMIFMDIKFLDTEKHKHYCGVDNHLILENFLRLQELSLHEGFEIKVRLPLIPDITDTEQNISSIALFLHTHQVKEIHLLPNNPIWHEKCQRIGFVSSYEKNSPMRKWFPKNRMESCKKIFSEMGVKASFI